MSSENEVLLSLVAEQGWLTAEQFLNTRFALFEAKKNSEPFKLREFWLENGWLDKKQLASLEVDLAREGTWDAPTFAENDLLLSVEQLEEDFKRVFDSSADLSQTIRLEDPSRSFSLLRSMAFGVEELPSGSIDDEATLTEQDALSSDERKRLFEAIVQAESYGEETTEAEDIERPVSPKTIEFHKEQQRYVDGEELGRGGLGKVVGVYDKHMQRQVARKTLLKGGYATSIEVENLLKEGILTGQLEHPNIIPIYDMGVNAKGQPYYTMPQLPKNNLQETLETRKFELNQVVKILQQVCLGLGYAHSRGVVHCDLKPSNIALGHYGEVYILDWGLAHHYLTDDSNRHDELFDSLDEGGSPIRGTPLFMAPELLRYEIIAPSVDLYALGVILYLVLCGSFPFYEGHILALVRAVCTKEPLPPSLRTSEYVPESLERICLKLLEKKPEERYLSCQALYDDLVLYLEGIEEKKLREQKAKSEFEAAKLLSGQLHQATTRRKHTQKTYEFTKANFPLGASYEERTSLWKLEEVYLQAEQEEAKLFGTSVQKYTQALAFAPEHPGIRRGLASLYMEGFLKAEQKQDLSQQIYYRNLIELYEDEGALTSFLDQKVTVELTTDPPGAEVVLYRYVEQAYRQRPIAVQVLGETPLSFDCEQGSHLLKIHKEGYREVSCPIFLEREAAIHRKIKLYNDEDIGKGYVYVPGGTFYYGGDLNAPMGGPLESVHEDDFFMSKYPVSFGEYLEYFNELHQADPELAASMIPRSEAPFLELDETGRYTLIRDELWHGSIKEQYPAGEGHEARLPAFSISWFEAILYCRWRSQKEGRLVTLPTEHQWEKAARGADKRFYPWGNRFDPSFCKMRLSRKITELQPEPLGVFEDDRSVYGIEDVVGSIAEWVLSYEQVEVDAIKKDPRKMAMQRGGGWVASRADVMRICSRLPRTHGEGSYNTGFRVVTFPKKKM